MDGAGNGAGARFDGAGYGAGARLDGEGEALTRTKATKRATTSEMCLTSIFGDDDSDDDDRPGRDTQARTGGGGGGGEGGDQEGALTFIPSKEDLW